MDLGIIGNCQYNALINPYGNVEWLCWPRFDSSFVFGGLLDKKLGGAFQIGTRDNDKGIQKYIENTNILVTTFNTPLGDFDVIDFAPRFFQHDRYFKPTLLVRIVRPLSGEPVVKIKCQPFYEYGKKKLLAVMGSHHIDYIGAPQLIRLTTDAPLSLIDEERPFLLSKPLHFVLTWGAPLETFLQSTCDDCLKRTIHYWQTWTKHCLIPRDYQAEVIRSALVLKLHQYEDTGAIIASATTSIPEAEGTERNWDYRFCWLRDTLFSLTALQRITHFEELEHFLTYLRNLVEISGQPVTKIQPVYGISGESNLHELICDWLDGYKGHKPVRVGNQAYEHYQNDVYGEMILAISPFFLDRRFSHGKHEDLHGGPVLLLNTLLDRIEYYLEAMDAGLWELRGIAQLTTFTVFMHWLGAKKAIEIGEYCGLENVRRKALELKAKSEVILETRCWDPELQAFSQAAGSKQMDASLLLLINFGYFAPNDPRAKTHLAAIEKTLLSKSGLVFRYVHSDDFGKPHNAFTICCFWLVEAYAHLGEIEKARQLFEKLLNYASPLGLFSEDLNPHTFEQWGNFPQTYSHVGLINAAFAMSKPWGLT